MLFILLLTPWWAISQEDTARVTRADSLVTHLMENDSIDATLDYQYKEVSLAGGTTVLTIPSNYKFLDSGQVNFIYRGLLNKEERAPKGVGVLLPIEQDIFDDPNDWIYISYVDSGYVHEQDLSQIEYGELLLEFQTRVALQRDTMRKYGRAPEHVIGWYQWPTQDTILHRLSWALELVLDDVDDHWVRYETRILGRSGYVAISAKGAVSDEAFKQAYDEAVNGITFKIGSKYSDYRECCDPVTPYGTIYLIDPIAVPQPSWVSENWQLVLIAVLVLALIARRWIARKKRRSEA